ncbi:tRNA1(Val) (adenine(37)-N6)-methyltransferase [Niabella beijingensis]|uniref:tRNA1(Val) (adenine(37)-N6)-methyltransferase n=1 Tax=Niabella beijingensis TaxID=2872700 RepID=UPI001CC07D10|nr:methyltransferase [Niabella beijingensis]MBZ4187519.1 methyltransferase [Niabella beijingensis]
MPNPYFRFKQFIIRQDRCAMKVTTDACLFGAWVAAHLAGSSGTVLDIGAGTGLLSLMMAQAAPVAIEAIEIQPADYEQAAENIAGSPWSQTIRLLKGDVLQYPFEKKYRAVVSNPPFYEGDLRSAEPQKNIAHHSAMLPLLPLLQVVQAQLEAEGDAFLLLPAKRKAALVRLLGSSGLYLNALCYVHQTELHDPFRIMVVCGRRKKEYTEERIVIRRANEYTPEFKVLLQPYYLYL